MHDANGLTFQGWLLFSVIGIVLLALACTALAYFVVLVSTEDRNAMDCEDAAVALSAPRGDDPERSDSAADLGVMSSLRADLERDLSRRKPASVNRRVAEAREGRPIPPAAA